MITACTHMYLVSNFKIFYCDLDLSEIISLVKYHMTVSLINSSQTDPTTPKCNMFFLLFFNFLFCTFLLTSIT